MWLKSIVTGELKVNCYLLGCPETRQALVIDPGGQGTRILEILRENDFTLKTVINTHGHFDHIGGNSTLIEATKAELLVHRADLAIMMAAHEHAAMFGCRQIEPSPEPTRFLEDGEEIRLGTIRLEVIHLPGHSPGGICLLAEGRLFSGDSLFAGSIGRTDLPSGDQYALMTGLRDRLMTLPDETIVYPGHGPETTIGQERRNNPFLRTII
jgi:glyoxylase-like metal-dependent hydrolase (beta-lactamase superfamily II)